MEKLGKYTIVEKIGVGGFGEVYKGYDPFIKRYIAVKTCSTNDQEVRTRFFQEAEIAGNLHHRNVTTVHDFGIQDDLPYLIQEYLSGEDLDRKVKRRDFLPFPEKLYYLLQIARGLGYAHSRGIIHRDIKPANIRVLEDGTTKIMDFGIARLAQQETGLTQTGMTLGTAAYLAPEQIRGDSIDLRTDIFSFGVLAYELLAYERPFPGKQISTVLFSILNDEPKPLIEHWPGVPDSMVQLTDRCLEKDPQKRFDNGTELSRELERIQKQSRTAGTQVDDGPTVLLSPTALKTDSEALATGSRPKQQATPPPAVGAPTQPHDTGPQVPPSAPAPASPAPDRMTAQAPLRPSSDSHSLDQLEFTTNTRTTEADAGATRSIIATAAPTPNHSAKVALIIALALLAGVAGWWFGTRAPASEEAAGVVDPAAVDVSGDVLSESKTEDEPGSEVPTDNLDATSGTTSEEDSPGEDSSTQEPVAPPAPGKIILQPVDWTENLFVDLAGKAYPMINRWPVTLQAGSYRAVCRLEMAQYQAKETVRIRLASEETRTVTCPIQQPGALSALALPGRRRGQILINDEMIGGSPVRQHHLAPGDYNLTIRSPDGGVAEIVDKVTIISGRESIVSFDLEQGRVSPSSKELPFDGTSP